MVHLHYEIPGTERETADSIGEALELSLSTHIEREEQVVQLRISMFSMRIIKREMRKNTTYTFPYISVTVLLLTTFTVVSCMTNDWISSKPLEALFGICSSSLAVICSAGLMYFLNVPFISQVTVVPFIALAIGVDDTYILLAAWQHTNRRATPIDRLADALREAGSSITVTSLTDVLSFAVGAFSTTPAIAIFCKFTAAAIFFDFLFQVTFFAAITALGGRREYLHRHCVYFWQEVLPKTPKDGTTDASPWTSDFFARYFVPIICKSPCRIGILVLYTVYLLLAIYGCSLLRPNLMPSRLLMFPASLKRRSLGTLVGGADNYLDIFGNRI